MTKALYFYKLLNNDNGRIIQAEYIDKIIQEHFHFDHIEFIETGVSSGEYDNFGLYFAKLIEDKGGSYNSVDINEDYINKAKNLFEEHLLGFTPNLHLGDSVQYLKFYTGSPNLVHLDSYDLNITNPLPSMLHHWQEFESIRHKMPSGSILIIDDNYLKGTVVYWNIYRGKELIEVQPTNINYDIVGKGGLIYTAYLDGKLSEWELLGDHYKVGENVKLIFKKK